MLGHLNATQFEPEKAEMWSDDKALQNYMAIKESVPQEDIAEVVQSYKNQTPLQWEGDRFPRASLLAYLEEKITLEQHRNGVENYNQLNRKNQKWKGWEFLPRPYTTLKEIEKSVSPKEITEVTKLIDSSEGLVSSDGSPIFWEGLKFPHACLCAFLQEKISLNQLVSATMVWGILQDSEIKEASLVKRKPLQEIQLPCKEGEPKSEHYFYEITIPQFYTVAKAVKIVGEKKLLPPPFILESNTLKIPSFSSLQLYLDEKFGEDAILLVPRWGCSTKNEIYELMLCNHRTFGIDVTGNKKPDNIVSKSYGFSLHDFYHAYRSSSIPIKHRQAFLKLAKLLIEKERNNQGQISIFLEDAWEFIDMEFHYPETDHPDKEQTHFYKNITELSLNSKRVLLEHFKKEKLVYQNEYDIDIEPLLLLLSDGD